MKILLVNDDGIAAPGIRALAKVLAPLHEVSVVAPAKEQSGMSQALSVGVPLIVHEEDLGIDGVWARSVEGTPADCTKLALEILLKEKPDLVISGINNGANLGTDVLYSGTVGAALEGYNHGIPSLAVSISHQGKIPPEEIAAAVATNLNKFYSTDKLFVYNINFPDTLKDGKIKFVFTRHGRRLYDNEFDVVQLSDGSAAYKMQGRAKDHAGDGTTDIEAVNEGFISVTPLSIERTDFAKLAELQESAGRIFGGN